MIYAISCYINLRGAYRKSDYTKCCTALEDGNALIQHAEKLLEALPDKVNTGAETYYADTKSRIKECLPKVQKAIKALQDRYGDLDALKNLSPAKYPAINQHLLSVSRLDIERLSDYVMPQVRRNRFMDAYEAAQYELNEMSEYDEGLIASYNEKYPPKTMRDGCAIELERSLLQQRLDELYALYNFESLSDPYRINEDLFKHASGLESSVGLTRQARQEVENHILPNVQPFTKGCLHS